MTQPPESQPPESQRPEYKGAPLDPARGPGLGCFWVQVVLLGTLLVLTPIGVANAWPGWLTTLLLAGVLVLTLFAGQTVIFLLRIVSADRRSRRRPLGSGARPTVGDLAEDAAGDIDDAPGGEPPA